MGGLAGKVALVTGGGSGIGLGIVARFVAEGARVGVLERSPQKAAALKERFGGAVCTVVGDVARFPDNERAVRETVARFGRLDVLLPNAGVFDQRVPFRTLDADRLEAAFDEIFSVNVKGVLFAVKAALPHLLASKGCVVVTVSHAAFRAGGGGVLYTASKHAVAGLVRQLAHELAPDVRVNGVAPGYVPTGIGGPASLSGDGQPAESLDQKTARVAQTVPLRFVAEPDEYAGLYKFLASEEARMMTGTIVLADLGVSVRGIR